MIENNRGDLAQSLMKDILTGLKQKFVQPIIDENRKLDRSLRDLKDLQSVEMENLKQRVAELEKKVEQTPTLVLTAIRDAINQTSPGGDQ
jgi:polyhydroxyalkanoate synthesis regulator phasin